MVRLFWGDGRNLQYLCISPRVHCKAMLISHRPCQCEKGKVSIFLKLPRTAEHCSPGKLVHTFSLYSGATVRHFFPHSQPVLFSTLASEGRIRSIL